MKNVLKGGLRSLIPNRRVDDADDVVNELLDGEELESAGEGKTSQPRVEKEVRGPKTIEKKVSVVAEDVEDEPKEEEETSVEVEEETVEEEAESEVKESEPESEPEEVEMEEEPGAGFSEGEEVDVPQKPLVTPLTISRKRTRVIKSSQKTVEAKEEKDSPASEVWDRHEEDIKHVLVEKIYINPNQPRRKFDELEMGELKSSIDQHGILQPLVVRRVKEGFELVAGERRLRAAKSLGWDRVPCVVRLGVKSAASQLELALVENIQRQNLNPVEEALAYRQLNEEYGMTHEEIGERVGRSRVGVTNIIRVLQLPEEIRKGLVDDIITPGHAKAILMIPDEEKQLRFYRHLVEEGLTVRRAETRARRIQRQMNLDDPMRRKRKGRSAFEVKYSGVLEDRYGYNARLKFNNQKNRYEILFRCYSKEEIDELVGRLVGELPLADEGEGTKT